MKKSLFRIILLFLFVIGTVGASAGASVGDYKGCVVIKNNTLEERGDTLYVAMEVLIKQNSVPDYAGMRLLPKLVSKENVIAFPDILIQGNNERKTYNRWLRTRRRSERMEYKAPERRITVNETTDTLIVYSYRLPYQEWMDEAQLLIDQEIINYRDERSLVVFAMDSRIKLSPRVPYLVQPQVNYIEPAAEDKRRNKQGQAFLDFQVGKSTILPGYRRNHQELEKIRYAFEEITSGKDTRIEGFFIEGYASPDGKTETNERLARDRAYAFKDYVVSNFGLSLPDESIRVEWVAEDWDGLKAQVQISDFRYKDQVLKILEEETDILRRKQKLQSLAGGTPYRMMLQDIYPQLRRVEYQIDFSVRDFSVEETKLMLGFNSSLISHLELFRAAQTYLRESRDFENIMLDTALQLFPSDPVSFINAAAVLIGKGEYGTARRYLERYENDPRAWNNLGVLFLIEGDLERAAGYLSKAAENGVAEATYNLDELARKLADNQKLERYSSR